MTAPMTRLGDLEAEGTDPVGMARAWRSQLWIKLGDVILEYFGYFLFLDVLLYLYNKYIYIYIHI